jgi:small subunit ribosomal protein S4e
MSNKGEKKNWKALSAPKSVGIKRKQNVWTVKTKAGTHKKEDSVALGIVLRDLIGIAGDMREARDLLKQKEVEVNGIVRKKHYFGVGLFDIIELKNQKEKYRIVYDRKRKLIVNKIEDKDNEMIVRINYKRQTKKGIQITTSNGNTYLGQEGNVGDSIKIKNGKIEKVLKLKQGAIVYIKKGLHCAEKGKIKEITKGSVRRDKLVKIEGKDHEFETIAENVIIIGENKEEIKV